MLYGLLLIVGGLLEPVLWRGSRVQWTFVLLGCANLLNEMCRWTAVVKPGVDTELTFSEHGFSRERPRAFAVPWQAVLRVFDDGELITVVLRASLTRPNGRKIVVPRRAFADGGVALWRLFGTALIGTRMLVPSTYARNVSSSGLRSITNTRS